MHKISRYSFFIFSLFCFSVTWGQRGGSGGGLSKLLDRQQQQQPEDKAKEYELAGITVSGSKYLDQDLLIAVSNLTVGQKIHLPNDEGIAKAIRSLWKQELFSNVKVTISKFIDDKIFLNIAVEERPRLSRYNFRNIKTGEAKELKTKLSLIGNKVVTEATKKEAVVRIKKYYVDKGFGRVAVSVL